MLRYLTIVIISYLTACTASSAAHVTFDNTPDQIYQCLLTNLGEDVVYAIMEERYEDKIYSTALAANGPEIYRQLTSGTSGDGFYQSILASRGENRVYDLILDKVGKDTLFRSVRSYAGDSTVFARARYALGDEYLFNIVKDSYEVKDAADRVATNTGATREDVMRDPAFQKELLDYSASLRITIFQDYDVRDAVLAADQTRSSVLESDDARLVVFAEWSVENEILQSPYAKQFTLGLPSVKVAVLTSQTTRDEINAEPDFKTRYSHCY